MIITGFIKNSLVDYPGLISSVLFSPGCNFDCFYCHNRMLLEHSQDNIDNSEIFDFLKRRKGMLDGVVITGGEPTLQEDLLYFIQEIKNMGYKLKLDTNGSNPSVVNKLLDANACDYYAVDYKAPSTKYTEICGKKANAESVLETINILLSHNADFEVRTTVYPQLNEEDLLCMSRELPILPKYVLNRYRKPQHYLSHHKKLINQTPYTQKEIEALAEIIRANQPNIIA